VGLSRRVLCEITHISYMRAHFWRCRLESKRRQGVGLDVARKPHLQQRHHHLLPRPPEFLLILHMCTGRGAHRTSPCLMRSAALARLMRKPALATASSRSDASTLRTVSVLAGRTLSSANAIRRVTTGTLRTCTDIILSRHAATRRVEKGPLQITWNLMRPGSRLTASWTHL
jgi:hypothetical protein